MPSDRVKDALDGIRLNIEAIATFTKGMTFEQFSDDLLTFYAVTRALEIISEASRRLPDEFTARYPDIRWRAIRDAGNIYRHTYNMVSTRYVWDTALQQLEGLKNVVARTLGEQGTPFEPREHRFEEGSNE